MYLQIQIISRALKKDLEQVVHETRELEWWPSLIYAWPCSNPSGLFLTSFDTDHTESFKRDLEQVVLIMGNQY